MDWNGDNQGLEIKSLPEALRDKIFKSAPKEIEEEIDSILNNKTRLLLNPKYFDIFLNITNKRYLFQKILGKNLSKKNGYLRISNWNR